MSKLMHPLLLAALVSLGSIGAAPWPPDPLRDEPRPPACPSDPHYVEAIQRTSEMVWDEEALRLAQQHGLDLVNLTWEDTGRYYGSSVGPNISDLTIQVQHQTGRVARLCPDPDAGHPLSQLHRPHRRHRPRQVLPAGRQRAGG